MVWLLAGYAWFFVHRPFEVWPIFGRLHIERIYMLALILVWIFWPHKRVIKNRIFLGFTLLCLAILLSWTFSPFHSLGDSIVENYFKQIVFFILVITSIKGEDQLKLFLTLLVTALGLYLTHSFREYLLGRHVWAMGTYRMIGVDATYNDPNAFGATIVYSLPLLLPLFIHWKKAWQRLLLGAYAILAVTSIILTGSRSSFAALLALILVLIFLSKYKKTLLIGALVCSFCIWGSLRGDLRNRYLTLVDSKYGDEGAKDSAEGRTKGFFDGISLLKKRPLFGVGPGAFGKSTGTGFEAHNLYGQTMGELGSFGSIALLLVLSEFFLNIREARRIRRSLPTIKGSFSYHACLTIGLAVFMLLFLGWAGHNLYRYTWIWYGALQAIALDHLRTARENAQPSLAKTA